MDPNRLAVLALAAAPRARGEAGAGTEGYAAGAGKGAVPEASGPAPVESPVPAVERPPAEGCIYDRWETIGPDQGLPSRKVLATLCEADRVWACTEKGLAEIRDGKVVRVWGPADGLAHRVVTSCVRSRRSGDLWVGTFGGLSRLSGGKVTTWRQTTSGLMNDVVYGVDVEGDRVWVATAAGLSWYDAVRNQWGVYDHNNATFHEPWIYSVSAGEGVVWIGVGGGGGGAYEPGPGGRA